MKKEKQSAQMRLNGLRLISLNKSDHPSVDGYLYRGDGMSFPDEEALQLFLNTYCGIIVPRDNKTYDVWCYNADHIVLKTSKEYKSLPHPEKTVYCNGKCLAKVTHDPQNKLVTLFTS